MRAMFDIALNELRILLTQKGIWLELVVIPIVISTAVSFANGGGTSPGSSPEGPSLVIDVIDNDNSALSQQFLQDVRNANAQLALCPADNNEADLCRLGDASFTPELAQQRLEDETSLALIEIPAGFETSIEAGEPASVLYRSSEDGTAPSFILQAVQAAVQRVGGVEAAVTVANNVTSDMPYLQFSDDAERAAFEERVREQARTLWATDPVHVEFVQAAETSVQTGNAGFQQSIPGISSMYVMFTVLPAAAAFLLERKLWTLQRLVTMPVTRAQILGGKLLARFVMGMIQYGVLFGFGLLLGVRYGNDPLALLLVMVAFTVCVTALALALTTVLQNEAQANGITLFLSLTLAPLGGAWWSLDIVPEWMRVVGHISPIAWAMDGFRSLFFFNGDLSTVVVPVLVLLAMAAAFFTFGVVRFRFD